MSHAPIPTRADSPGGAIVHAGGSVVSDFIALSKPGITRLVTITAGVGFAVGAVGRAWTAPELVITLIACLVGVALSAGGANALNQCWERKRDALMPRTMDRPIPRGRVTARQGVLFAFACLILGAIVLGAFVNRTAMAIAIATTVSYILFYTPMKARTPIATLVGAVPGALPPLIGWTAAAGGLASLASPVGWSLFALLFAWQIPHFHAIAWMYKDDYAAGGFKPLPVVDPTGARTARSSIVWSIVTLAVSCVTPPLLLNGWLAIVATALTAIVGLGFVATAVRFARRRDRASARRMFFGSIIYLPLALGLLALDAAIVAVIG